MAQGLRLELVVGDDSLCAVARHFNDSARRFIHLADPTPRSGRESRRMEPVRDGCGQ